MYIIKCLTLVALRCKILSMELVFRNCTSHSHSHSLLVPLSTENRAEGDRAGAPSQGRARQVESKCVLSGQKNKITSTRSLLHTTHRKCI